MDLPWAPRHRFTVTGASKVQGLVKFLGDFTYVAIGNVRRANSATSLTVVV